MVFTKAEIDAKFAALNVDYAAIAAASKYDRGFYERVAKYLYDTLGLIDRIVDLYGDDIWSQSTKSIYDHYELYDLSKEELMVLGSLIIVSRFIP